MIDPTDKYLDVRAYIHEANLAQQAKTPHLWPWPPVDTRLRHRCADAFYQEQIAFYEGWITEEQKVTKHIDLSDFNAWRVLPGRQDLYNRRKLLKAEWEKKQPKSIGLTAATNAFAPPAAKLAEEAKAREQALQVVMLDTAQSSNLSAQTQAMQAAHPGMQINFIDGTPSIPPALPRVGKLPPPPPPVAPPAPPTQRVEIPDDPPKNKNLAVPLVKTDTLAPAATQPEDQPTLADIMNIVKYLRQENRDLKRKLASGNPVTVAASPVKKVKQEPGV